MIQVAFAFPLLPGSVYCFATGQALVGCCLLAQWLALTAGGVLRHLTPR